IEIKRGGRIHPQTILTEIGALAGFAAQMSIRKSVIAPQQLDPSEVLAEIVTRNGETYYFSDTLNWILFENVTQPPYSIWASLLRQSPVTCLDAVARYGQHRDPCAAHCAYRPFRRPAIPSRAQAAHAAAGGAAGALAVGAGETRELPAQSRRLALRSRLCGSV